MWFKNLQIYRLPAPWAMTSDQLEAKLAPQTFAQCSSVELQSQGWVSPRANGMLVHTVNKQMLLMLGTEKKLLPATVINQVTKMRAVELEEQQGFKPGRKQMKDLKEQVADELLPRAFSVFRSTLVWIDPVNGWLVVDAASPTKADEVLKLLLKSIDKLPLETLHVQHSPVSAMTDWLVSDEAPGGFTVDQDTELRATGESKATVRYVKHTLVAEDVRRHISSGKQCTRLAMTWADKVSFVLTESLTLKKITPLDVLKENESTTKNDEERFDTDMALMTGELNRLMTDLVEALGGEMPGQLAA
jgi:recombination associated protein RdgC